MRHQASWPRRHDEMFDDIGAEEGRVRAKNAMKWALMICS